MRDYTIQLIAIKKKTAKLNIMKTEILQLKTKTNPFIQEDCLFTSTEAYQFKK